MVASPVRDCARTGAAVQHLRKHIWNTLFCLNRIYFQIHKENITPKGITPEVYLCNICNLPRSVSVNAQSAGTPGDNNDCETIGSTIPWTNLLHRHVASTPFIVGVLAAASISLGQRCWQQCASYPLSGCWRQSAAVQLRQNTSQT